MYSQMHPCSCTIEATISFLLFHDKFIGPAIPVKQPASTRGARLWMLSKRDIALGDTCGCLNLGQPMLTLQLTQQFCQDSKVHKKLAVAVCLPEFFSTKF